jgi:hypothetical protein
MLLKMTAIFSSNVTCLERFGPAPTWLSLLTTFLHAEEDGVQLTLPILISPNPTDEILCKTLFIMWYIWKARNDNRFQRKTWTSSQVHHAANAHMNTHFSALREQKENKSVQQPTPAMPRNIVTSGINSSNAGTQRIQQQHADHSRQGTDDTTIDDQGIMDSHAGINQATLQENKQSITMTNRFLVPSPTLLEGY